VTPPGIPHGVPARRAVLAVDSGAAAPLPAGGAVLVLAADAPGSVRRRLAALRPGADSIALSARLAPVVPRDAVGGHPLLLHEGAPVAGADRAGDAAFIGRNPRTAVGLSRDRRHLLLVTVDGRRPGWSVGMSLAELTALLQGLGAWEALNLDGGGSTTLVVRAPDAPAASASPTSRATPRASVRWPTRSWCTPAAGAERPACADQAKARRRKLRRPSTQNVTASAARAPSATPSGMWGIAGATAARIPSLTYVSGWRAPPPAGRAGRPARARDSRRSRR
jgi:hypothetical protein